MDPIVEIFSDASFRSYVIFPYLAVVKKLIIELFDQLKSHKLIETEFGIVRKNSSSITVKQLTPFLLTKSKNIFFHEILYSSF